MYDPKFTTPDIGTEGENISVNNLADNTLHLLAQRAPTILYDLNINRRREFLTYIEKCKLVSPVDAVLKEILRQAVRTEEGTVIKVNQIRLADLIGESAIRKIQMPKRGGLGRAQLLVTLQQMFFSEKSSFAQSGIFAASTPESTDKIVYNSIAELIEAYITVVVSLTIDNKEHPFLWNMIKEFKGKVGRLLASPRQIIRFNESGNGKKIGVFDDTEGNSELEVVLGDKNQRYDSPKIDANCGSIIIPLCPTYIKKGDEWIKTKEVKFYKIEQKITEDVVVNNGSRKALAKRETGEVEQTDTLKPGETMIMEIPIDIGPYDADIEVVCVDGDGKPLNVIHFPATYLDAVRTFADGENRMQVEIKNMGTEPVIFKDIHFKVKLFETDKATHERFRLRRRIQEAEKKGFHAIEHLVYTEVLHGEGEGNLSRHTAGLGHLANLDNLFPGEHMGLIFSQEEKEGLKNDKCQIIQVAGGVSHDGSPPLLNIERSLLLSDLVDSPAGYQADFVSVMKKSCSVGREKKVIFVCRSNIDKKGFQEIIEKNKVTDVFCIPGHDAAVKPENHVIQLCNNHKIKLTSIEIKSAVEGEDIVYDLVGKERN